MDEKQQEEVTGSQVESPAATAQPGNLQTGLMVIQAPSPSQEAPGAEQQPGEAEARGKESFWSRPGWIAVILVGLLSSCLGVVMTLAILGVINHGLAYASPQEVSALQAQVQSLQTQVEANSQDLSALRERVAQLEELAARTTTLERLAQDLQSQVEKGSAQAQQLQDSLQDVQTKIADVVTQSQAFQSFVQGLRDILSKLPTSKVIP